MIADTNWRIDKKIPVALLVTILLQTCAIVAWGTRLDSRVSYLETGITRLEINDQDTKRVITQFAVMSEKMTQVQANSIETKQDIGSVKQEINNLKEEIRRSGFNGKR